MRKLAKILCVVLLLLCPLVAHSQECKERPKVGLVLSGGGAKGAAHIGVLKYIEEAGIPIDTKAEPLHLDISTSNISRTVNLYFSYGYFF